MTTKRSNRLALLRAIARGAATSGVAALLTAGVAGTASARDTIAVCATTPDLGSLAQEIGGDRVAITVFVKPREDPHFAEAKPSFVKATNQCALWLQNGLDLEAGYAPAILQAARNPDVLPGSRGFLDASRAIAPKDVPTSTVDRSMGDVHPFGNPHYLLDPLNGVAVARAIADRLGEIDPASRADYDARFARFQGEVYRRLVGDDLARKYGADVPKLATLYERGRLPDYLEKQGEAKLLGGWLGAMAPHFGAKVVQDHLIWTYFAERFGLQIVGALEPKPGIPPTTRHMNEIIDLMRAGNVRLVLASAYYDPKYARLVADETGAKVLAMANLVGAVPGTETYVEMVDHDVREVSGALAGHP
jgi:zinc/manganese transport system substrate-binding protein